MGEMWVLNVSENALMEMLVKFVCSVLVSNERIHVESM